MTHELWPHLSPKLKSSTAMADASDSEDDKPICVIKQERDKEKAAPAFSFTDYVKYQDAIKAVLKRRKWKRKLAQGKNPPLPVI